MPSYCKECKQDTVHIEGECVMCAVRDEMKMVTITEREYKELKKDSAELQRLIENGVDNWEGYSL